MYDDVMPDPELLESSMFLTIMEVTHGAYTYGQLRRAHDECGEEWRGILFLLGALQARNISRDSLKPI